MKPSQEYTIKILKNEDFDNLPYPRAKEALGMSVMKTKTAYIRETGIKGLDQSTLEHEFDELMAQTSEHEIDGIRYKLPLLGPLFAALGKLIGGAALAVKTGGAISGIGTAAKLGVGLGKAAMAIAPAVAATGVSNLASTGNVLGRQKQAGAWDGNYSTPSFDASPVTQAFSPVTDQPLGQSEFQSSLGKLSKNADLQEKNILNTFRGRSLTGDTAFSRALSNTRSSNEQAKQQFLADQKKLGSTFV